MHRFEEVSAAERARWLGLYRGDGSQYRVATLGNCLKWRQVEKREGEPANYTLGDIGVAMLRPGTEKGVQVRGHNVVWPTHNPDWLVARAPQLTPLELRALLERREKEAVGRYAGQLFAWDVVNEPLRNQPPAECLTPGLDWECALIGIHDRALPYTPVDWTRVPPDPASPGRGLGRGAYLDVALRAAKAADPSAAMFVNECEWPRPG